MLGTEKTKILFKELERLTGIGKADILSKSRSDQIVKARFVLMYYLRKKEKMSYPDIGFFFSKDHTTIQNAIRRVDKSTFLYGKYKIFKSKVKKVYEII